jgi:hypothetical protein
LGISAPARAAEACLAAPKGAAPDGSHWRYRIDQASQRKCWRLVQQDRKGRGATAQATQQGDTDDDDEPAAAPPAAKKSAGRLTDPQPKAPEALITKDASNTTQIAQAVQWPDPPASMMQSLENPPNAPAANAPAAPTQTTSDTPAPAATAEQPAQPPTAQAENVTPAPASDGTSTLRLILTIVAASGLLTYAISFLVGVRRRRTDVLNRARHLNRLPVDVLGPADDVTFQPLPPMSLIPQRDDVEETMRRMRRSKHRAA